ncbi:hypothetical protein PLICRDRAFT_46221 [Plicaturopsis crispa FD-325 SS-3]|uniref:Thioredoxin domain-containing protein n=1 Tax=Plicaturopsis crispa FD-325 SS-3 TaxID=944288 RepID=A0A0C9SXF5_PLICR|nr:hypothetical protein PLICRDRAFT_46221 [Plicaturopsis crispa FD-325 SS-3]
MSLPNLHQVTSPAHFQSLLQQDLSRVSLLNFHAPWADPCIPMNAVVRELAAKYPALLVLEIDADEQDDVAESFSIESVPSFLLLRGHTLLSRIAGADAPALTSAVAEHLAPQAAPLAATDAAPAKPAVVDEKDEESRLRALMTQSKIVLFMKGTPAAPRCGFSRRMVGVLESEGITEKEGGLTTFDVLEDESVRSGLKKLNNWPTFPQLIVRGEFVGGLDVVQEMVENGELREIVGGP